MHIDKRNCVRCGQEFEPNSYTQKYCEPCGIQARERQRKERLERLKKKRHAAQLERKTIGGGEAVKGV